MPKDKERIALSTASIGSNNLNVITLQRKYGGKETFKVTDERMATFGKKTPKPVVDLIHEDGNEFYFGVNVTNQARIGECGYKFLDEIVGKMLTLEVHEGGGVGNFAFEIHVTGVE